MMNGLQKIEAPLLLLDLCWPEDNELFNVDVIRLVSSKDQESQAPLANIISFHSH